MQKIQDGDDFSVTANNVNELIDIVGTYSLEQLVVDAVVDGFPQDHQVSTTEYIQGSGFGGNTYRLVDGITSRPAEDGGSIIHVGSAFLYLEGLFKDGVFSVARFGAPHNDDSFDSAPVILATAIYARSQSSQIILGTGVDINARCSVVFNAGAVHYMSTTASLDLEGVRVDFKCLLGSATISGAKVSTPSTRSALGFDFNRLFRTKFVGLNLAGFEKIMEFDTNNVDSAIVIYDNCEFHDSGVSGVATIDTRSFALSGSTELIFENCRTSNVPRLLDCYCDKLTFNGGIYRNGDADGSFIKADSNVTVNGGMFVPYFVGDNARWFDLYDVEVTGSRGFNSYGTRWSPESGGIPVVYNYMNGEDVAGNHQTNFINFFGGSAETSAALGDYDSIIILTEDSGESIAPSFIGIYGASVKSSAALIRTESGSPVNKSRGRFAIDISKASQSHLADYATAQPVPLVEAQLRGFLVCSELYNEPVSVTLTATTTIDLTTNGIEPVFHLNGSGSTVVAISNAFDGQKCTLMFNSDNITVQDFTNGSRMFLAGELDFNGDRFSTITLQWHRAGNKWVELSRSAV